MSVLAGLFRSVVPLLVAILVAILVTPAFAQSPAGTAPTSRPNFLVILSDDQRHDTMDYMPRTKARIFGEGVSFPNAYTTTPLCCPSRASILTGMYAHKHGVRLNPIPLQKETFVQHLKKSGYFTGQVGKYLNSWDGSARPEFDFWAAGPAGTARYFNPKMNINGTWSEQHGYLTHILRDYAIEFLRRAAQQDQPFVLLFSPNAPHFAYPPAGGQAGPEGPLDLAFFLRPPEPAPGDERLYENLRPHRPPSFNKSDLSAKPRWFGSLLPLTSDLITQVDDFRRKQLQTLAALDQAIESVLSALAAQGKLDETVVVYLSDNGHFWGEHGIAWGKNAVYEEASRVPFAVRYPRLASRPRVETRLVANIDIAPTFYELAGLPIPPEVDGRSLVPLLDSARTQAVPAVGWRDELLIEGWSGSAALKLGWAPYAAIHTGRYVYVETEGDRSELYDLATDPHQQHNQAGNPTHASVVADLKARLKRLRPASAEK
jgi:N-acetylglucosamine-6-sulfatase